MILPYSNSDQRIYHYHQDRIGEILFEEMMERNRQRSFTAGTGIMAQMEESSVTTYEKNITYKDIEDALNEISGGTVKTIRRSITLITGELGMWRFEFTMKYGGCLNTWFHLKNAKYMKGQYISLFAKRSNFKLYIEGNTFKFYYGTKLLKTFYDIVNEWNVSRQISLTDPVVGQRIQMINDYIDDVLLPLYEDEIAKMELNTAEDKARRLARHTDKLIFVDTIDGPMWFNIDEYNHYRNFMNQKLGNNDEDFNL